MVSAFLDSMVFAGGQMVPTLIKTSLAMLYSADAKARTSPPGGVALSGENAAQFALEMLRFVPQAFQVRMAIYWYAGFGLWYIPVYTSIYTWYTWNILVYQAST